MTTGHAASPIRPFLPSPISGDASVPSFRPQSVAMHLSLPSQIARGAQNVKSMINVLVTAIPGFVNVLALIALVLFMYAYVGVYLFGHLMWNSVR